MPLFATTTATASKAKTTALANIERTTVERQEDVRRMLPNLSRLALGGGTSTSGGEALTGIVDEDIGAKRQLDKGEEEDATDERAQKGQRLADDAPEPWGGGGEDGVDYQAYLKREGYVVIPTPLVDATLRARVQQEFDQHIRESPEFSSPAPNDSTDTGWKPQLGGFAAMGNPSSFHHPTVRGWREKMLACVLETDAIPVEGRKLEECFDRLLYRIPGEEVSPESMHRDEAKTALETDVVFGGWVNLEDVTQVFSCCPRSHTGTTLNKGFAKIEKAEYDRYRLPNPEEGRPEGWKTVKIPAGTCLIFYERLVHEVASAVADRTMIRMFLGWRVTDADASLFGEKKMRKWIDEQGVPKIKSGQNPSVYPSAYYNYPRIRPTDKEPTKFNLLSEWSVRTFVPECLYTHRVDSGEFEGYTFTRVKYTMHSLKQYGLKMHRAYDQQEREILTPRTNWELYTFASPTKRIQYKGVTPEDWMEYRAARRAAPPGAEVRRPRPYWA